MPHENTVWDRGSHTEGKHIVLDSYLGGWLPIHGTRHSRLLFIDGFAGPGVYETGESGSPLIALNRLIQHHYRDNITAQIVYLFIEQNAKRAQHLQQQIDSLDEALPDNCDVMVINETFDTTMTALFDLVEQQKVKLGPIFVMADPFGVSGVPIALFSRILQNPHSEIFVTFMYEYINRFISTLEFESKLDNLFGCEEWRQAIDLHGDKRKLFLYDLYAEQLKKAGAEHVIHFELYNDNRLKYAIFFGSQHYLGCDKMKYSIWRVAPEGDYAFRGRTDNQMQFTLRVNDFEPLKQQLLHHFGHGNWVDISEVEQYVKSDRTLYYSGHLKKRTLKPMEKGGEIEVDEDTRNRKGTYPEGTRLRFIVATS